MYGQGDFGYRQLKTFEINVENKMNKMISVFGTLAMSLLILTGSSARAASIPTLACYHEYNGEFVRGASNFFFRMTEGETDANTNTTSVNLSFAKGQSASGTVTEKIGQGIGPGQNLVETKQLFIYPNSNSTSVLPATLVLNGFNDLNGNPYWTPDSSSLGGDFFGIVCFEN
jgi:hypothetical protein